MLSNASEGGAASARWGQDRPEQSTQGDAEIGAHRSGNGDAAGAICWPMQEKTLRGALGPLEASVFS